MELALCFVRPGPAPLYVSGAMVCFGTHSFSKCVYVCVQVRVHVRVRVQVRGRVVRVRCHVYVQVRVHKTTCAHALVRLWACVHVYMEMYVYK